jgi:ubiquinone/menaquinone biosynthesis C-methylase UbiE
MQITGEIGRLIRIPAEKMTAAFSSYFSKQARKPSGLFGCWIAPRIFEKGNTELNDFVFDTLSVGKQDRLLEIGFGTGLLMNKIARHLEEGLMEGIDFSKPMVDLAIKKNRRHIDGGKVRIHSGDFDAVFFEDGTYDTIFTVNTIYFWQNTAATLAKIHRLLKPGGKLVIGFHAKHEMEQMPLHKDVFRYYTPADMKDILSDRWHTRNIQIMNRKGRGKTCYCAVAVK